MAEHDLEIELSSPSPLPAPLELAVLALLTPETAMNAEERTDKALKYLQAAQNAIQQLH